MKKTLAKKIVKGKFQLTIDSNDPIAWKLMMLIEYATSDKKTIAQIAHEYGYTREHFYKIKRTFEEKGSEGLSNKLKGPKRNYRRTDEVTKQIIRLRFLDPDANSRVITQKMKQAGYNISQRSVERTINEYGLQKKGYIKQLKKQRQASLKSQCKKQRDTTGKRH